MPAYFVPIDQGRPIVIDKAVIFIGRHPECDVVITTSRKISRRHCCICQVNENLLIRDLGSMNGIQVNGRRVKKEKTLALHDEIIIGDIKYRLQTEKNAPTRNEYSSHQDDANLSMPYPVPIPDESEDFDQPFSSPLDVDIQKVSADEHRDYGDSDSINDLLSD
ncbi:hypothetical protein MNBD_PLANCTO02-1637 [hydrothermal vent metagenome]|uniref:FHA domain-containing protein n=1 Tax=hydrothermal vent metagenome TaxID=652676 RepID=A0A3B1DHI4_9ZZZZ